MNKIDYTAHYWHSDKSAKALFEPIAFKPSTQHVTASFAFIFDKTRKKIVLTKPKRGWGVPGGHREKGETPEQCAIRESYEETNVRIKNLHIIGRRRVDNTRRSELNKRYPNRAYILFYIAEIDSVDDFSSSFETSERGIVPIIELDKYLSKKEDSFFYEVFGYIKDKIDILDNNQQVMEPDKVSIVVPVYNTAKYLETCLESIEAQNYKNIQIILVDDKSTDRSLKICRKYQKKDNRIVLIENKHNVGLAESRNIGIKKADGKYLMFIDGDDFIAYDAVGKLVVVSKRNDADIVEFAFSEINEHIEYDKGRFIDKSTNYSNEEALENLFKHYKPGFTHIEVWNKFYKTEIFKENILFPSIRYAEDLAIIVKVYLAAKKNNIFPRKIIFL